MFRDLLFTVLATMAVLNASSQPPIVLLDNYYQCNGCTHVGVSRDSITHLVQHASTLDMAQKKIRTYFTTEGDRFALFKKGEKPYVYIRNTTPQLTPDNGFGTYMSLTHGGNQKGGEEIFKFNDLLIYLTDSLIAFDTLHISTANISGQDPAVLQSLSVSYQLDGREITRPIPYDAEQEAFTLSYDIIFGNKLTRSITDKIPVYLHYRSSEGTKVTAPGTFKIFFATPDEKKELTDWIHLYKKEYPDWSATEIALELFPFLVAKYNNASGTNFVQWLTDVE